MADANHLSEQQVAVLELIAQGLETKEIADILGVSPKTVEYHRDKLLKKLDLKSPNELRVWGARNGYGKIAPKKEPIPDGSKIDLLDLEAKSKNLIQQAYEGNANLPQLSAFISAGNFYLAVRREKRLS